MELTITSVDYAPEELHEQVPIVVRLLKELPGDDRPDYWLGELLTPIRWRVENKEREVTHVILAARWVGTRIEPGVKDLPVGIAYVTDSSLLKDTRLNFQKCAYTAIGFSYESSGGTAPSKTESILAGTIGRLFGVGNPSKGQDV